MPTGRSRRPSRVPGAESRVETGDGRLTGHRGAAEAGFTLASMVVIMAVMAIMLTVAVQSVTFQRQREKEEELIFRGRQAVEAIRLFRARNGRFPLTLKELVEADPRVLRKPWADPITGVADWVPVFLGQEGQVVAGGPAGGSGAPKEGTPAPDTEARGPIIGVHSRSCQDSIKVYDGRTRYCDWKFVFDPQKQGGGGGGGGVPVQPSVPAPGPTRRR